MILKALLWLPAVNLILNLTYKTRECYFNFDPAYIIIQDTIAYLIPMFIVLGITLYILKALHDTNKRRKLMRRKQMKKKSSVSNYNTTNKLNSSRLSNSQSQINGNYTPVHTLNKQNIMMMPEHGSTNSLSFNSESVSNMIIDENRHRFHPASTHPYENNNFNSHLSNRVVVEHVSSRNNPQNRCYLSSESVFEEQTTTKKNISIKITQITYKSEKAKILSKRKNK